MGIGRWFRERGALLWAAVWRPWGKRVFGLWAVFGAYDLSVSQFIPPKTAQDFPKIYELVGRMTGSVSIWVWGFAFLFILFAFTLEFAIRQNRKLARQGANSAAGALIEVAIPYSQWKNLDQIDLGTAAAIWSGTRDENDVARHLRFRELKQAVREKRLTPHFTDGRVNIRTTVRPAALHAFFANAGTAGLPAQLAQLDRRNDIFRARKNLAILRNKGVPLRNEGAGLTSKDQVLPWSERILKWHARVVRVLRKIDAVDAEYFKTVNYTNNANRLDNPLDSNHEVFFRCMEEYLFRLQDLMKKYDERHGNAPSETG